MKAKIKKTVQFSFANQHELTQFGGLSLYMEFLKKLNLQKLWINELDKNQGYDEYYYFLTHNLMTLAGGESLTDVEILENDSGLCRYMKRYESVLKLNPVKSFRKERKRQFPGKSAFRDFIVNMGSIVNVDEGNGIGIKCWKSINFIHKKMLSYIQTQSPSSKATLDMDNEVIKTEKRDAKSSYKGDKAYHPFNVYWAEQDVMLYSNFLEGNSKAGKDQLSLFKESLCYLPSGIQKIYHRSDTAGYQYELMDFCDSGQSKFGKIDFSISCKVSASFKKEAKALSQSVWKTLYDKDDEGNMFATEYQYAEVPYTPSLRYEKKSSVAYRYIAIKKPVSIEIEEKNEQLTFLTSDHIENKLHLIADDKKQQSFALFGIVTNMDLNANDLILWHRKRCGNSEQEHSRITEDLSGGRFPNSDFKVNAFWWMLNIIELNLLKMFQRFCLNKNERRIRLKKLRFNLFHLIGKITKHSRQWKFEFSNSVKDKIKSYLKRIRKLPPLLRGC